MLSRLRVFFGFLGAILFAWMSHPAPTPRLWLGLLIALSGVLLRGWAAGYLEKGRKLAQDGPYSFLRHPLYDGSYLIALGLTVAGARTAYELQSWILAGMFLLLFMGLYPLHIRREEAILERIFGDAWHAFVERSHRFLPTFPPFQRPDADTFCWARYRKNKEYQAALGFLAGVAILLWKGYPNG
jgi:protein-S-isoprenylcysteine O-methyltransferase Ste14